MEAEGRTLREVALADTMRALLQYIQGGNELTTDVYGKAPSLALLQLCGKAHAALEFTP